MNSDKAVYQSPVFGRQCRGRTKRGGRVAVFCSYIADGERQKLKAKAIT